MWKITKDKINSSAESEVGRTSHDWNDEREKRNEMTCFRLLDDDGVVYFHGVMPTDDAMGDEETCGAPLNWAMSAYGCTLLQHYSKHSRKWEDVME